MSFVVNYFSCEMFLIKKGFVSKVATVGQQLQEVQVGKGVMSVMESVVLPFINQALRKAK